MKKFFVSLFLIAMNGCSAGSYLGPKKATCALAQFESSQTGFDNVYVAFYLPHDKCLKHCETTRDMWAQYYRIGAKPLTFYCLDLVSNNSAPVANPPLVPVVPSSTQKKIK